MTVCAMPSKCAGLWITPVYPGVGQKLGASGRTPEVLNQNVHLKRTCEQLLASPQIQMLRQQHDRIRR
jgi:hypothetical protein